MSVTGTVLPVVMVLLGAALVIRTVSGGGGPLALGAVMGVLFLAAGVLRLWAERRER